MKPAVAPTLSEAQLKRVVLGALEAVPGIRVLRLNSGAAKGGKFRGCPPGTPDILVMLPHSRCLWIELKTLKGKARDTQDEWHAKAGELDHTVIVGRDAQVIVNAVINARNWARNIQHIAIGRQLREATTCATHEHEHGSCR